MTQRNDHISLEDFWPYQVTVLADQISRYTISIIKEESDLNSSQWRVLAAVVDKPGRSSAEVTTVTPMDKTIVSRAVSSLIDFGIIKKSQTTDDKRRQSLTATDQGLEIYKRIATRLNQSLGALPDGGTSPAEFIDVMKQYSQNLKIISLKAYGAKPN